MKSATRKYSGRARTAFERKRQDRLWMEDRIDEFFEPSAPGTSAHVAPVRLVSAAFLDAPQLDVDDSGCDWGSIVPDDEHEAGTIDDVSTASGAVRDRGVADRGLSPTEAIPVIRPARLSRAATDTAQRAAATPAFRWSWFLLACVGGTAVALALVWLVIALLG